MCSPLVFVRWYPDASVHHRYIGGVLGVSSVLESVCSLIFPVILYLKTTGESIRDLLDKVEMPDEASNGASYEASEKAPEDGPHMERAKPGRALGVSCLSRSPQAHF